uniref:T-box domain-containing protein n=1 Tax=Caenorhabditis tropicalis TaxID=1561998 RepID=A0A1I7V3F7_9PELO
MSSSSTSPSGIQLSLSDAELWKKFYPGTEMVLTSTKPRKMFPNLEYNIKGLDPDTLYSVLIYMERCDKLKYHFKKGKWEEAANSDPILQIDQKQHKDGGQTGDHWMKQSISFDHIRLTNNESLKGDQMILMQSMHLYQPVVVIKRLTDEMEEEFRLEMTRFYTVTAYQCEEQIKLKKELNKFASGFRAEGGHNRKKKDLKRGKRGLPIVPYGIQRLRPLLDFR